MSKGYYYSKSKLSDSLNSEIELDEKIGRIMGTTVLPKREPRSIDEIISNKEKLKELIRKDLGKIMLADDLDRVISYLQSRDELGLFYKTYDAFMKKMGNPTRLGFTNFEINWGKFDKEENVKELKRMDNFKIVELQERELLEKKEAMPLKTLKALEQISKLRAFNEEVDRIKKEDIDEYSKEWIKIFNKYLELEGIIVEKGEKEFEESAIRSHLYSKQIEDFEKIMAEFEKENPKRVKALEDLIESSKSELESLNMILESSQPNLYKIIQKEKEIKETLEEVKDEISEVESTLPKEPTEISKIEEDLPFLIKARDLLIKTEAKAMPAGFSIKAIRTALDKYRITPEDYKKVREAFNTSEVIKKKKEIVKLIDDFTITGSGFNKKRRMKIIEGSIEAGNNNPKLSERLWLLKYRK